MAHPDGATERIARLQIENEKLRSEVLSLRQFIDSMQNLREAMEQPNPDAELMDLLAEVLRNALQTINAKDGSLLVLDEDTDELVFIITQGDIPRDRLVWRRLPPGRGIAGWVAQHRVATIVNDAREDDRFYAVLDDELDFETHSVLAAPIVGAGRVLGVIEVLNKHQAQEFTNDDRTLLNLLCRFAGELLYTIISASVKRRPPEAQAQAL